MALLCQLKTLKEETHWNCLRKKTCAGNYLSAINLIMRTFEQLTLAADQFIVKKGEFLKTIIAGYHWFSDWGRDTMISLPGLCLSTGRFEDAKKILSAFAKSVNKGMLPNRFGDNGQEPEYNNVDGTLWFFIAVNKYLEATGDRAFVLKETFTGFKRYH